MEMITMQVVLGAFLVLLVHVFNVLVLRPRLLRAKLQRQGIQGPSPHFYFGNIPQIKTIFLEVQSVPSIHVKGKEEDASPSHAWPFTWLVVTDLEILKEIIMYTSLDLGKPTHLAKDLGPLLGHGILTSSGQLWANQRKIIAPELYLNKVKGMVNLIVESTNITLRSWEAKLESEGAALDINVNDDLRSLSADIISRACFGSNYIEGKEIFSRLRDLQKLLSKIHRGIPGFRYVPNKTNRQIWRLEKEINSKISKLVKQRQHETHEQDLLQTILEGAKNCVGSDGLIANSVSCEKFIIDNCKNIFFAGHETTATSASWCLMLLAVHQDCQDRVRAEVLEVCGKDAPNATTLRSLKTLTMVIQESLRLYSPQAHASRTAFKDINLKGIVIPKETNINIPVPILNQDPRLWGPDAHKFNPGRFENGVLGACKVPQLFIPFGIGPRVCVGQHLAMTELKVVLSLILSKFYFSLSPSYCHSPANHLVIEPDHGVVLKMTKI
ncbi:hypothetical protein Fmac_020516 [Flemingia macrophylla]|uniref:Cytochrome P450 n=1 Tax=Flemingia macrophylla TaxID=520843 RepID=A0ABD1LU98_9FABA